MSYKVKEIYYTLQGEGANTGRAAVFCRFSGCNLWSGREEDRATATCQFCDTDFFGTDGPGGGRFETAEVLARTVAGKWPPSGSGTGVPESAMESGRESRGPIARPTLCRRQRVGHPDTHPGTHPGRHPGTHPARSSPLVVCTGGEPLLQLDEPLIAAFHEAGFELAIETNGTLPVPPGLDWICVSPKAGAPLELRHGNELKLVYPQPGAPPEIFETLDFRHFYLQPMDGPERGRNTQLAVAYCMQHPHWRLSLQTHKYLHIP